MEAVAMAAGAFMAVEAFMVEEAFVVEEASAASVMAAGLVSIPGGDMASIQNPTITDRHVVTCT